MSQSTFILPRKHQASPLVKFIYSDVYIDEPARSKCPRCQVQRVTRTCAKAERVKGGNTVYLAFDFCKACRRVKRPTKRQERSVALVTNIQPLRQSKEVR